MSKAIVRFGGVCAVVAAMLIIVQQVWGELVTGPREDLAGSIMHSAQLLLMVFGVIGIALAQQHRAGAFAQIAALVAIFGCVLMFAASLTEVTMLPELMAMGSPLVDTPPQQLIIVGVTGFVGYLLGLLLLSVAVIVTGVLPRLAAVVLGGGVALGVTLVAVVPGILAVYAIGLGWLGVAGVLAANKSIATHTPVVSPVS